MSFFKVRQIKATRKVHRCEGCEKQIDVGQPATYAAGQFEGDFWDCHWHPDCREAEMDCNKEHDLWGEEYCTLWVLFEEVETTPDRAWLQEKYPAVFARVAHRFPEVDAADG